jgi:hypothetical protein
MRMSTRRERANAIRALSIGIDTFGASGKAADVSPTF